LVFNVIILGWVLRAMGKIVQPLLDWERWAPWLVDAIALIVPAQSALGGPSEAVTVILLVCFVALYSSLGGIRGVIRTDLVQFALGLVGSIWLAVVAWTHAGGKRGVLDGLQLTYGDAAATYTRLFPSLQEGWASSIGLGAFGLGAYLLVQSYANVPADGGGYLQQRLSATRSEGDAQKAASLFFVLQYGVRIWPWLMVALAALVILPVGSEVAVLGEALGTSVANDREMAYPALMIHLLPPGVFGVLVVSLLAAFMSTIDTHFNWGASYVVSDVVLRYRPGISDSAQVFVARASVVLFALGAVLVAFQIEYIEQAWRWVAALGAALGIPTILRWLWWRMTAVAELAGAIVGLVTAAVMWGRAIGSYEVQLIAISVASLVAVLSAIALGPKPDRSATHAFMRSVAPLGFWPDSETRSRREAMTELVRAALATAAIAAAAVLVLWIGTTVLL
jgi:Na+/proline symporter